MVSRVRSLWNWLRGRIPYRRLKPPAPRIYAKKGEEVTCENGHVITVFARSVNVGDFSTPGDLVDWRQREPTVGEYPVPPCEICGKPWYDAMRFHFADGWRGDDGASAP